MQEDEVHTIGKHDAVDGATFINLNMLLIELPANPVGQDMCHEGFRPVLLVLVKPVMVSRNIESMDGNIGVDLARPF